MEAILLLLLISFNSLRNIDCTNQLDNQRDISEEKRLITTLLANYDRVGRSGRPVLNVSQAVTVKFGLGLIQLDLDERNKILTMSMWTRYQWQDEYMQWNISEYGGVKSIRLKHDIIWIPDVTLYNTADVSDNYRDALAAIDSDGTVQWYPHTIYRSSCSIDVTNFPYDHQACHMWFGSWTHTTNEIDLHMLFPGGIDLSTFQADYKDTCSWEIVKVSANRSVMPSEEASPNFAVFKLDIRMSRKRVFSTYILTLPCVFLACLTLVVFWLPPERPDRIGLAMSIFSSFMLLLLILIEAAPPTASSVPKLGVYYCFNMVIIMVSIFLSCIIINISRGFNQPVPRWLYVMTNSRISRLLCARYINSRSTYKKSASKESDKRVLTQLLSNKTTRSNQNHMASNGHLQGHLQTNTPCDSVHRTCCTLNVNSIQNGTHCGRNGIIDVNNGDLKNRENGINGDKIHHSCAKAISNGNCDSGKIRGSEAKRSNHRIRNYSFDVIRSAHDTVDSPFDVLSQSYPSIHERNEKTDSTNSKLTDHQQLNLTGPDLHSALVTLNSTLREMTSSVTSAIDNFNNRAHILENVNAQMQNMHRYSNRETTDRQSDVVKEETEIDEHEGVGEGRGNERAALLGRYSLQWRQVAVVLDRVFFMLYVLLVVGSLLTLFPREDPSYAES